MNEEEYLRARAEFRRLVDEPATGANIARLAELTRQMAEHDGLESATAKELETNLLRLSELTQLLPWEYRFALKRAPVAWPASRIAVYGLGLFAFLLLAGMFLAYLFPDGLWPLDRPVQ